MSNFIDNYLIQSSQIIKNIDQKVISLMVQLLKEVREHYGRLFLIGSGGGAGHASHATCDFRKLCGFDAVCPLDNVSELTARINDEGWEHSLAKHLLASHLGERDALFVFSVGGGSEEHDLSINLVQAIKTAKEVKAKVLGIVGNPKGYTALHADACLVIPTVDQQKITPHTEGMQAVIWHLLVSHPDLQKHSTKWESLAPANAITNSPC
jgi:D-sedoheptulose 7-phosphate isomerase